MPEARSGFSVSSRPTALQTSAFRRVPHHVGSRPMSQVAQSSAGPPAAMGRRLPFRSKARPLTCACGPPVLAQSASKHRLGLQARSSQSVASGSKASSIAGGRLGLFPLLIVTLSRRPSDRLITAPPEEVLLMLSSCNQSIAAYPYASIDAPGGG